MAVQDLWLLRDGTPSRRHGRGLRYRVVVRGHPSESYSNQKAAIRREGVLLATPAPVSDTRTVGQLLDLWVASKSGLTEKAQRNARRAALIASLEWGGLTPDRVEAHAVQAWLPTVGGVDWRRKVLQALKGGLRVAGVDLGRVSVGTVEERPKIFLTVDQVRALADAVPARHAAMVWLLSTTGVRISECIALSVEDVDVKRRRLLVRRSKAGRPREVPIPESVLGMLDTEQEGPLFRGRSKSGRLSRDAWRQKVFQPAAVRAKLPTGLRVHDLRHTAASLMIASGATVKDVQQALGHKSAAMTLDIYASWWDAGLDDVGVRMDALVRTGGVSGASG